MGRLSLRIRAVVGENWQIVLAVFLLLALTGGWVTYTAHVSPGTVTDERRISSWQTTGQVAHSATVVGNSSVFERGETLRNRSAYFRAIAPVLDGQFIFRYSATDSGNLTATTTISLVARSVDTSSQNGESTILWRESRPLRRQQNRSISPGERVTVPFSINVTQTAERTRQITRELGGSPGETSVLIQTTVTVRGRVNGRTVEQARNYTVPLSLGTATYSLGTVETATHREETTQTVRVPRQYGPLWRFGGPVVLTIALTGVLGSVYLSRRGDLTLSSLERRRLAFEEDRTDFNEWISTIRPPEEATSLPRGSADSLAALVDFAIDTNNSVLEHPDTETFYVVHDDYCYTYDPPQPARNGDSVDTSNKSDRSTDSDSGSETLLDGMRDSLAPIVVPIRRVFSPLRTQDNASNNNLDQSKAQTNRGPPSEEVEDDE